MSDMEVAYDGSHLWVDTPGVRPKDSADTCICTAWKVSKAKDDIIRYTKISQKNVVGTSVVFRVSVMTRMCGYDRMIMMILG